MCFDRVINGNRGVKILECVSAAVREKVLFHEEIKPGLCVDLQPWMLTPNRKCLASSEQQKNWCAPQSTNFGAMCVQAQKKNAAS